MLTRLQTTTAAPPQHISRRSFLRLLGLAAPVATAAPKYFFAPIGGRQSDVIANPADFDIAYMQVDTAMKFNPKFWDELTMVTLEHLRNNPITLPIRTI